MRRFGFNHAGRFSAKYKSIFGHLPSEGIQVFKDASRETNSQQLSLF
jgi:AraC-like DNA-binding protein